MAESSTHFTLHETATPFNNNDNHPTTATTTTAAGVISSMFYMSSFYVCRFQKCKKTDSLTVFFELLGSVHVKAARKTLMKLTSGPGHGQRAAAAAVPPQPMRHSRSAGGCQPPVSSSQRHHQVSISPTFYNLC